MRNCENGVESRCGSGFRKASGGDPLAKGTGKGLYLPADVLEMAGFSHVTNLDNLVCTIEDGRILLELPEEDDEAAEWDELREELPSELCALLEDLGVSPETVWDILEEEGWFD